MSEKQKDFKGKKKIDKNNIGCCGDIHNTPIPPCEPIYTPITTIRIYPDGRGFDENNNFIGYVTINRPMHMDCANLRSPEHDLT